MIAVFVLSFFLSFSHALFLFIVAHAPSMAKIRLFPIHFSGKNQLIDDKNE